MDITTHDRLRAAASGRENYYSTIFDDFVRKTRLGEDELPPTIPACLQDTFTLAMKTSARTHISSTM